jgi:hypothetical protein
MQPTSVPLPRETAPGRRVGLTPANGGQNRHFLANLFESDRLGHLAQRLQSKLLLGEEEGFSRHRLFSSA